MSNTVRDTMLDAVEVREETIMGFQLAPWSLTLGDFEQN